MKLLLLGGTQFVGRHLAESAIQAGHEVTLFNRGKTNQNLFPAIEKRVGDRNGDLSSLEEGEWDAVIDVSGYVPSQAEATAKLLHGRVGHYIFISTVSVYEDFANGPASVGKTKLAELKEDSEVISGENYGPLKQKCEEVIKEIYEDRALCIRPGLIVGPDDPTDRFTYWVDRVARGGQVAAPGEPSRQIQWIDVRDLSEWIIRMMENKESGTYNAAGLKENPTMEQYLHTVKEVTASDAELVWVKDEILLAHDAGAFVELPFWIPRNESYPDGFILADAKEAIQKGLTFRTPEETIRDTYQWQSARKHHKWKAGLSAEKEEAILQDMRSK
ncbi:NAD-dependent epimerase/dehydratase family protein [Jeotgalibacillus sp. S-D1]|uniref:NAD-dependent epimerase/dehydratase family protein n=1 Tax=Jeotgalibacillus sp. S-D1 TaxID=2552189 RepID=UPI001059C063|nr:NAD-dependent epimerase/dehydratase family protein [Jeotgalibacillus sp. S-D1]TDL30467.1 NAD-dependent epimerase/dehydratase family protein [Jeotgalibacillus sp. S-D1]